MGSQSEARAWLDNLDAVLKRVRGSPSLTAGFITDLIHSVGPGLVLADKDFLRKLVLLSTPPQRTEILRHLAVGASEARRKTHDGQASIRRIGRFCGAWIRFLVAAAAESRL